MTKAEAHLFITRWRRILIPWVARTEAEALHSMKQSCLGMAGGGLLMIFCALLAPSFWRGFALLGLFQSAFSFYLVLRFREVGRILAQSEIPVRKS